jgi:hypothetical protein
MVAGRDSAAINPRVVTWIAAEFTFVDERAAPSAFA